MALTATLFFSTATPIARAALVNGMNPDLLLVWRIGLATLLTALTIAVMAPRRLIADRRCATISVGAGLINSLGMVCYFQGLLYLESSMAAMIISTSPLVVLSLLALRGEKVTYRHAVRVGLALTGIYLLIGPGGDVSLIGVIWISTAIVAFAVHLVILQWYLLGYDARTVTFYVLLGMTAGVIAWWWVQGMPMQSVDAQGWFVIIWLAVISTYLARLLLFGAVTRIGGAQMTLLSPLETLLAVIWSMLFLDERLTPIQWAGGLLVLISAALAIQRLGRAQLRPRWRLWAKS